MTERVILTEMEKASPVWAKVHQFLEQRLDTLRMENDTDSDERTTARRRGAIAEVKTLIALGKERPIL